MNVYIYRANTYTLLADLLEAYHRDHGKYPDGPMKRWFNPLLLRWEEYY